MRAVFGFRIILELLRGALAEVFGAAFDVVSDFRKGRAAVRAGEFEAVIGGRIVAGSDVYSALQFAAQNLESDCGSRGWPAAKKDLATLLFEDVGGGAGKFLGKKARIIADENGGLFVASANVPGDGGGGDAHTLEGEIFSDDAAPSGGAEVNRAGSHEEPYYIVTCLFTYQGKPAVEDGESRNGRHV